MKQLTMQAMSNHALPQMYVIFINYLFERVVENLKNNILVLPNFS